MSIKTEPTENNQVNYLTLAAITILAYMLAQLVHEGLGHGFAAWLAGAHINQITNTYLDFESSGLSVETLRWIAAAGSAANVLVGLASLIKLRTGLFKNDNLRFFAWLFGIINLLKGFGYLLLTFAPIGDWNELVQGLPFQTAWMIGLTLLGAIASLATFFYAARTLDEFIGQSPERRRHALTLTIIPYLIGGTANLLASIIGLGVTIYAFTGSLATFGGTWLLVWVGFAVGKPRAETPAASNLPSQSTGWLIVGGLSLIIYFFWFGGGLIR